MKFVESYHYEEMPSGIKSLTINLVDKSLGIFRRSHNEFLIQDYNESIPEEDSEEVIKFPEIPLMEKHTISESRCKDQVIFYFIPFALISPAYKNYSSYFYKINFDKVDDSMTNLPKECIYPILIEIKRPKDLMISGRSKELIFESIKRYCTRFNIRIKDDINMDMNFKDYGFTFEFTGRYDYLCNDNLI